MESLYHYDPNDTILIHRRQHLHDIDPDSWPQQKKHQYYYLGVFAFWESDDAKTTYLRALEAAQYRTDINYILIHLNEYIRDEHVRVKLDELLNNNNHTHDRLWSVLLYYNGYPFPVDDFKRALSILRNVHYLKLPDMRYHNDELFPLLDCLPPFQRLQCLDVDARSFNPQDLDRLVSYPFASQLHGILLEASWRCDTEVSSNAGNRLLSVHANLHYNDAKISRAVTMLHSLQRLRVELSEEKKYATNILNWLTSPECPVTDIHLDGRYQKLPWLNDLLPQIPLLRSVWVKVETCHDIDTFLEVLLKTRHVESITLERQYFYTSEQLFEKIFAFQLEHRPRLFSFQLMNDRYSLLEGVGAVKVHYVSMIHQVLIRLKNSRGHSSFPLVAWAIALKKLNDLSCDACWHDVQLVGVDAQFNALQHLLLGDSHANRVIHGEWQVVSKRRKLL